LIKIIESIRCTRCVNLSVYSRKEIQYRSVFSLCRSTWEETGLDARSRAPGRRSTSSIERSGGELCLYAVGGGIERGRAGGGTHGAVQCCTGGGGGFLAEREGKRTRSRSWLQSGRRVCTASVFFDLSNGRVLAGTRSRECDRVCWIAFYSIFTKERRAIRTGTMRVACAGGV